MAIKFRKDKGSIECFITKLYPNFIDAKCAKTGRNITFQLKFKMSDKFKKWCDILLINRVKMTIVCVKTDDNEMYKFIAILNKHIAIGKKAKSAKNIAIDNLMKEVNIDYNPVFGKNRQKLSLGRSAIKINSRTNNSKISNSLLANIASPKNVENKQKTKEKRKADLAELRRIKNNNINREKRFINWCEQNNLEQDDKNWLKFLDSLPERNKLLIERDNEIELQILKDFTQSIT